MIPMPFTRVVFSYGDPIVVPRDADESDLERYRLKVEEGLALAARRAQEALAEDSTWKA